MSYDSIASQIDKCKSKWIDRLAEAVAIPSISSSADHRQEIFRMIDWTEKLMTNLGISCRKIENPLGTERLADGTSVPLPPILFGTLGTDKNKRTLLVYGHLDVQPAALDDGWNTEPFKLVEKDGKLFGRGSTDDKGPVLGWLNVIETMKGLGIDMPINMKFVFEGMEECGSDGLDKCLEDHKNFLSDVDFVCISDNYWLGKQKPCITYGLRDAYHNASLFSGLSPFAIEISGPNQDLHSGVYGGTVHEPMNDLCWLLSQLSDTKGNILIKDLDKMVAKITAEERNTYAKIDFDLNEITKDIGVEKMTSAGPKEILMRRWRQPSLSIHGVEGAFSGKGLKTVIPSKVIGKFSIRIVPNMVPEEVDKVVVAYVNKAWEGRASPNKMKIIPLGGTLAWLGDFKHPHFQAGVKAIKQVYELEPDFTREGGSIPVTLTFQNLTGKSVMLLPMGASDDMAHSQNEKLNVSNYVNGMKMFAAYIFECAKI